MKKATKLMTLVLALVLALTCFAGCGKGNSIEAVQKAGVITVATSPDFPPFESLDGDQIVGIEVDVMAVIAEELGVEVEYVQMDFDSVLPGVQAGKFDVGMSGITVTAEREENADFTMPYFLASQAIIVPAGSDITCKDDLTGKVIAVQTGTTAEAYCMDEGYDVQAYQANNDAAAALTSGKCDAWVVDNEVAVAFAADLGDAVIVLDEKMTSEPYAFAFVKGSETLVEAFNEVIVAMIEDGTMEAIFTEYGVTYVAPEM